MNKYWSNEDDKKVSYITGQPPRDSQASGGVRAPEPGAASRRAGSDAFSYSQALNRRDSEAETRDQRAAAPQYGTDRSSFISDEVNGRRRSGRHVATTPKHRKPPEEQTYEDGYQVHSENPQDSDGGRRGGFWLRFLIVLLVLSLIGGGTYLFRYEILSLVGNIFGEEVVWRILPTPAPTEPEPDVPAYAGSVTLEAKPKAMQEIHAVTGDLDLNTFAVTEQNIVMQNENQDGTYDYYLFAYDTGRLLGYYEKLNGFIPCGRNIFCIDEDPYLITSRGFPLANLASLQRSAGSEVSIRPMINGWAMVTDTQGTALNFVGEDGALISDLWFCKAFPFTDDTTLAYVDTGNLTDLKARYALYLLKQDGGTKRLQYVSSTDGVMESVCGMAFLENGEMRAQDEALTLIMTTDDAAAYVNCGALIVRDPDTKLYGLFVGGVQQYPFAFDSIEPMPSELIWAAEKNGYVTRYAVMGQTYPLPRAYSFILRRGDTQQIISIAAVSVYPIVFD